MVSRLAFRYLPGVLEAPWLAHATLHTRLENALTRRLAKP